jgi:hypothetical protein
MQMKASFVSFLQKKYPHLSEVSLSGAIADGLLSPFQVSLTQNQVADLQNEIKTYWKLREWSANNLSAEYEKSGLKIPENFSACMSYDFHINENGKPELIEINTNAAFLALGLEMYELLQLPVAPTGGFSGNSLVKMFKDEGALAGKDLKSIVITDEKPQEQRLFIEFLIYNEIFKNHGINSDIADSSEIEKLKSADLIYNRNTDFYFQNKESENLRELFNQNLNFSPNPYEYFLLADKQRLLDWNEQTEVPKPSSLLPVYDLGKSDKDEIWQNRKHLFIKPKNSFGSKQAYKAASISHKIFDEIFNGQFIAQKLSVPSEIEVNYEGQSQKMKYDLRCFAYKDDLQLIVARLYQGQTTNLRTPGGGFAAIKIG